ncbi:cob(I)yrinic acid a c-diamide adenosyltransferase, putative [Babesia ovata]|uniref:Cob(I)yrinic acid a c-diamide adenosyltransferase, putative n=1 Tax=Babesia ovata TaxID=189622 RepID=A0A2H6KC06_9APIC|nr:cob(I)yrinic acid a c-diamide adenosyltransferase, putative [Babesia ovata]GBE60530.1 cob(I)yrinic acid a c-diamide adenosyltransferase, putative [Babesia ovata]
MYRLHTAPNQKLKFILSTYCLSFEKSYGTSKVDAERLVMALDPEFLALMLRSSPVIASSALTLIMSLLSNKSTARHLSTLTPHVGVLLSFLVDKGFEIDSTTSALIKQSASSVEVLKARLISDCLSFFHAISTALGLPAFHAINMDAPDLSDVVDDLSKDMFDLVGDDGMPSHPTNVTAVCRLCELVESREFKEAASEVEHIERDLDALAAAHLEDVTAASAEHEECDDDDHCIGALLLTVGKSVLGELSSKQGSTPQEAISINVLSLKSVLELIPSTEFDELFQQCLSSGNFDVMAVLFDLCKSSHSALFGPSVQIRVSQVASTILEQSSHKSGIALASCFLGQMIERHGFVAISSYQGDHGGITQLQKRLYALVSRCEIEIHLTLHDFLRLGSVSTDVNASFRLLEAIIVCIGENESIMPACHELFAVIHRTMTTVFEFFDEISDNNRKKADSLLTCCCRLIGCWMTLEPMHLRSLYLSKLSKILSAISAEDFAWLLPSFDYLDAVDFDGIKALMPSCLAAMSLAWAAVMGGNSTGATDGEERRTLSMCYRLLERMFVESVNDCSAFLALDAADAIPPFTPLKLRGFQETILDQGNVHFSPRIPLDVSMPIPIDPSAIDGSAERVCRVLQFMQYHFLSVLRRFHPKLESPTVRAEDDFLDLGVLQDALENSLKSASVLQADWSPILCEAALATAAVCLLRVNQSHVREWMNGCATLIIMECVAMSFAYANPRTTAEYSAVDESSGLLWHRIALCCTILLQRQPHFVNVFAFVCRKLNLKPLKATNGKLNSLVEAGWLSADCASACEFMCTLVSALR